MFPNDMMMKPETWNDILGTMIAVRDAHGWQTEDSRTRDATSVETDNRSKI